MSVQSEELARIKDEYRTLEQSWKEENEKFIQFQLLANRSIDSSQKQFLHKCFRDLQLVNHVLTENQKLQLRKSFAQTRTLFRATFAIHKKIQKYQKAS